MFRRHYAGGAGANRFSGPPAPSQKVGGTCPTLLCMSPARAPTPLCWRPCSGDSALKDPSLSPSEPPLDKHRSPRALKDSGIQRDRRPGRYARMLFRRLFQVSPEKFPVSVRWLLPAVASEQPSDEAASWSGATAAEPNLQLRLREPASPWLSLPSCCFGQRSSPKLRATVPGWAVQSPLLFPFPQIQPLDSVSQIQPISWP